MRLFVTAGIVLAVSIVVMIGCGAEDNAQYGDQVEVEYVGKLGDGTVFDSTSAGEPIEFTIGQNQVIPGFENGVVGMEVGDTKTITIPPEEGYGMPRAELRQTFPADSFPDEVDLYEGAVLYMPQPNGRQAEIRVTEISEDSMVTVDANHRLAGETLIFDITLVSLQKGEGGTEGQPQGE